ncbi:MAG TPA: porin family protein [Chitinophaga sp.]|uniref:porin family protein n=1 Tax=Chitinophaga sp. TaxID=1869181 RepID=UPI002D07E738|nr:porin family protein [Chitinophaga sp.]HVI46903.1 porin family protein [Chitinophaga sp.]
MKRKCLFLSGLLFGLLTIQTQAQGQFEVGITGGYNKNYVHTSAGARTFAKYDSRSGFVVGIPVRYTFNNWLAVQAEPSYIQKNYRYERSNFFDGIYQNNTNSYVQLPLMAHFSFGGDKLKGFFNAGGYGAYWVNGRIKGTMANIFDAGDPIPDDKPIDNYFQLNKPYNYNEKYAFDSRRDRRMEFGLLAGAGVEYLLSQRFRFFVEGRYYYSLTDQQKDYMVNQVPRYNDTYVIQAGCLFNLRKLFHHAAPAETAK